jgi:hypothetical protein
MSPPSRITSQACGSDEANSISPPANHSAINVSHQTIGSGAVLTGLPIDQRHAYEARQPVVSIQRLRCLAHLLSDLIDQKVRPLDQRKDA